MKRITIDEIYRDMVESNEEKASKIINDIILLTKVINLKLDELDEKIKNK